MTRFFKILLVAALAFGPLVKSMAQLDPIYSQYVYDKMLINPAVVGSSNWIVMSMKHRNHLMGFDGAPMTNVFTAHTPVQSKNMGLGMKVVFENIAVSQVFTFTGFYSYHIGFGNGKLSFGLEGGMTNYISNYHLLKRVDHDDNAIPAAGESGFSPDVSAGIYYQTRKGYLGGSARHLFNLNKSRPADKANAYVNDEIEFDAMAGYHLLESRTFELEPGMMARYIPNVPVQADAYLNMTFLDRVTLGAAYRTGDAVSLMLRLIIAERFRLAYSYDYRLSPLADYSSGSHEISISYGIELLPPATRKVVHPRYYF